ncbi:MAG: ferrous iron transport protein B [Verrucomicrobiota bacterium]
MTPPPHPREAGTTRASFLAVLTGNPNCGKTTLFNALTGLRAKVGNYAGVTVERKEGALLDAPPRHPVTLLDLPGTYSLSPQSLDEQIARDVLFQRVEGVGEPGLVIVVVDASNLQRNLYYATQVIDLGFPTCIALNMVDVARENGHAIDVAALSKALGVPVFPLVASRGEGLPALREALLQSASRAGTQHVIPRDFTELPETFGREAQSVAGRLAALSPHRQRRAAAEAVLLLSDDQALAGPASSYPAELQQAVNDARRRLEKAGIDWRSAAIEARYARAAAIQMAVTTESAPPGEPLSDRLDRVLTHRVWGLLIFTGLMALMFQGIFALAQIPMNALEGAVDWLGGQVGARLPPGDLNDLLTQGVIAGVGAVVVFLPQICLLFLFIALLEDTGYMARAAFLMDRLMSRVGLHGKSFIPMLSSFACAIPGVMATRTIESPKDRLVTILVAPLMSCSARLPVYTVLIVACIPRRTLGDLHHEVDLGFARFDIFAFLGLPGLTLLAMYLLGIAGALGMAWLFKRTLLRGEPPPLILELPPYKRPVPAVLLRHMWERSKLFLRRAGTVILGINILLWFLATYPRTGPSPELAARRAAVADQQRLAAPAAAPALEEARALDRAAAGEQLRRSFAGRLGQIIEPALRPLGFDWKIGIGLLASFAAREVFVSTLSVVYNVGGFEDNDAATAGLARILQQERRPDGSPVYTPLTGLTLMVFYVFALQCVSTIAVVRRETNSWRWPLFQLAYLTGLAWVMAFVTCQLGRAIGLG